MTQFRSFALALSLLSTAALAGCDFPLFPVGPWTAVSMLESGHPIPGACAVASPPGCPQMEFTRSVGGDDVEPPPVRGRSLTIDIGGAGRPDSFDLGMVPLGETRTVIVTLSNNGDEFIEGGFGLQDGELGFVVTDEEDRFEIEPGEATSFDVQFIAEFTDESTDTLHVSSTAGSFAIDLVATGAGAVDG
jgi:hypothetical protein